MDIIQVLINPTAFILPSRDKCPNDKYQTYVVTNSTKEGELCVEVQICDYCDIPNKGYRFPTWDEVWAALSSFVEKQSLDTYCNCDPCVDDRETYFHNY